MDSTIFDKHDNIHNNNQTTKQSDFGWTFTWMILKSRPNKKLMVSIIRLHYWMGQNE